MQPEKHTQSVELSAQELSQVSGGAYDPNGTAQEGSYNITGRVDEYDKLPGWIDEKMKAYSDQYNPEKQSQNGEG